MLIRGSAVRIARRRRSTAVVGLRPHRRFAERRYPLNAMQLFVSMLGTLMALGVDVPTATAQRQEATDKVRVAKFLYDSQPAPQDVLVFKYPEIHRPSPEQNYLKRLVGRPGERIVLNDGVVFSGPSQIIERI